MKKQVLILGGTQFIGRNLVAHLSKREDLQITLFNRGITASALFPNVKKILGDRLTDDVNQLSNQDWDYVIDVSCYFPDALERVLNNLRKPPSRYIYLSTCSVYDNELDQSILRNEDAPTLGCSKTQRSDDTSDSYGNRKAECERILQRSGIEHTILRPSLVFGPHDHTDRFYYWLFQVHNHDNIMLPEGGSRQLSLTYVDDLVRALEQAMIKTQNGVYNIISLPQTSIRMIVDEAIKQMNTNPNKHHVSAEFLVANNIREWWDMPLWLQSDYHTYSSERMIDSLEVRPTPLSQALTKTRAYYDQLEWPEPIYGLSIESQRYLHNQYLKASAS